MGVVKDSFAGSPDTGCLVILPEYNQALFF